MKREKEERAKGYNWHKKNRKKRNRGGGRHPRKRLVSDLDAGGNFGARNLPRGSLKEGCIKDSCNQLEEQRGHFWVK